MLVYDETMAGGGSDSGYDTAGKARLKMTDGSTISVDAPAPPKKHSKQQFSASGHAVTDEDGNPKFAPNGMPLFDESGQVIMKPDGTPLVSKAQKKEKKERRKAKKAAEKKEAQRKLRVGGVDEEDDDDGAIPDDVPKDPQEAKTLGNKHFAEGMYVKRARLLLRLVVLLTTTLAAP